MTADTSFDNIIVNASIAFNTTLSGRRLNVLTTLCNSLKQSTNPPPDEMHLELLEEIIENAFQSNVPCEINAVANLISLAAIQLRNTSMMERLKKFYEPLISVLVNGSTDRSVLHAIAVLTFLYKTNSNEIVKVMNKLKAIMACRSDEIENYQFQMAVFDTWIFLMTFLRSYLRKRSPLHSAGDIFPHLDTSFSDMPIVCAKAVAAIYECGLDDDKKYFQLHLPYIIDKLSAKSREFVWTSEVLQYLQFGKPHRSEIEYGNGVLKLNSWALKVRYDMLCNVFDPGYVANHLATNKKLFKNMNKCKPQKGYKFTPKKYDDIANVTPQQLLQAPIYKADYYLCKITKCIKCAVYAPSTAERIQAVTDICTELQQNVVPATFLKDRRNIILYIVLRGMERGNNDEKLAVIRLATLTVLQLEQDVRFLSIVCKLVLSSLRKASEAYAVKSTICTALAFFELADTKHIENFRLQLTMHMRRVFCESQPKNMESKEDFNALRLNALEAMGLLFSLCSRKTVRTLAKIQMMMGVTEMLRSLNVELRVVCCQIICLIVETGRMVNKNFLKSDVRDICDVVKAFINDRSDINRDKRKLRNIKLCQVLAYLEHRRNPSLKVGFAGEVYELKSWCAILKYQKFSQFFGENLAEHMSQNERMRRIVPIGSMPVYQLRKKKKKRSDLSMFTMWTYS